MSFICFSVLKALKITKNERHKSPTYRPYLPRHHQRGQFLHIRIRQVESEEIKNAYKRDCIIGLSCVLGGSIGAWLGMKVWHHKTLHKKFRFGVPAIIIIQLALIVYFIISKTI